MNHPALDNEEFIHRLGKAAINKPSNSDIYTEYMAEFMETFERVGIPEYLPHAFFHFRWGACSRKRDESSL